MHNSPPKNRLVAALLCFFFYFLGLHRFYIGKKTTGKIQVGLTIAAVGLGGVFSLSAIAKLAILGVVSYRLCQGLPMHVLLLLSAFGVVADGSYPLIDGFDYGLILWDDFYRPYALNLTAFLNGQAMFAIVSIWGIIDFIIISCGLFKDKDGLRLALIGNLHQPPLRGVFILALIFTAFFVYTQ